MTERQRLAESALGLPGLMSEFFEAADRKAAGDPWPLAILEYRAGYTDPLADLVRERGAPDDPQAREFLADIVAGRFKPTKKDRGAKRNMEILMTVSLLQHVMEDNRETGTNSSDLNTMDDVYRHTARRFNLTTSGVQKVVERNRRRIRENKDNPTNPPGAIVADN